MMSGLLRLSAHEAIALMRRGELKAEEYAAAFAGPRRCPPPPQRVHLPFPGAGHGGRRRRPTGIARRAAGWEPLHGLPIPIKDSVNTADHPTTSGTAALRDFRPKDDAPVVRSLRDAGAIVLGKTNLAELSLGWTSTNGHVRRGQEPL